MDGLGTTVQEGDFQVSRRGKWQANGVGEKEKKGGQLKGVTKRDRGHVPYFVCVLIKDCV